MIVSQLTARRDYAIANILYKNKMLDRLFTDAYYNKSKIPLFKVLDRVLPDEIVKTYLRYQPKVPQELISYDWKTALEFRYDMRKRGPEAKYNAQIKAYIRLNKKVIEYCKHNSRINQFYGFDTAALEFFQWSHNKNFHLVLDQSVAPRASQIKMFKLFQENYGLSTNEEIEFCKRLKDREEQEWDLTNCILSPSNYVRNELIKEGAPEYKIKDVTFGYDSPFSYETRYENFQRRHEIKKDKLIVLFAGNAGARKGINELIDISTLFKNLNVEFRIAGEINPDIVEKIEKLNTRNITILGKLPLQSLLLEYQQADTFFLPSYLEGSARVIFEAMSWGLPILTSHETGSVITHGKEGYLFYAGKVDSMEDSLNKILSSPELRYSMGENAIQTCEKFSVDNYSKNLLNAIQI